MFCINLLSHAELLNLTMSPLASRLYSIGETRRFGAVTGNGYGLGYTIHEGKITVPITAFRGGETDGKLLANEVVRALGEIGTVCRWYYLPHTHKPGTAVDYF